jgi:anti-sigma regulatory factor (Ser/Thr protein kinase)
VIDKYTFPIDRASIKQAREFVAQHFAVASAADAARLMVSELATNCVRHAATGFTITITVDTPTSLRVDIRDNGAGDVQPRLRDPDPTEPTGRGLRIVATLADDWGTNINDTGGHTVWFSLSTQPPSPRTTVLDTQTAPLNTPAPSSQAFASRPGSSEGTPPGHPTSARCTRSNTAHRRSVTRHATPSTAR